MEICKIQWKSVKGERGRKEEMERKEEASFECRGIGLGTCLLSVVTLRRKLFLRESRWEIPSETPPGNNFGKINYILPFPSDRTARGCDTVTPREWYGNENFR